MNLHLTSTDYKSIADALYGLCYTGSTEQVIEYDNGDFLLIIQVNHRIKYRNEIGGSYENYDFERLVVYEECFEVVSCTVYNSDGYQIETDFSENILLNPLNR